MPSIMQTFLTLTTLTALTTASAVPSLPFQPLVKRADLQCPASDGSEYIVSSGTHYRIRCNSDTQSGSYFSLITAQNFDECIQACEGTARCNFVTFTGQSAATYGSCYLKEDYGSGYVSANGVYVARKLSAGQCL